MDMKAKEFWFVVGSQFLYPVFSAQPDTCGNCGADGLVRLYLGSGA